MRNIILSVVFLALTTSCANKNGLLMQTNSTIKIDADDSKDSIILKAAHVVPTKNQYEALKNEYIAFVHFGPNTFTKKEWGDGFEDPNVFNLETLDTDQWCKAMKDAQMKMVILTVKHHDGFVLWQSRYTKHGIMSSPFQDGKGDVLKALSASCEKYGLKLGVYLSPADLYQIENEKGLYGNLSEKSDRVIPRPIDGRPFDNKTTFNFKVDDYNEYFLNQLFELLTEYGPIHEVWFDGAHPKRKGGQKYNYLAWKELISTLAPEAVVFGKQDVRWCGNEAGATRDTEWNIIPFQDNPQTMNSFPDIRDEDIGSRSKLYDANYLHYQQAEIDTSIREGWFYRDDTSQEIRSVDDVFDMYERTIGGNATLLLNIPPNREGKFPLQDVNVITEVGQRINDTYATNLFAGASGSKNVLDEDDFTFELLDADVKEIIIETKEPVTINRIVIKEAITTHGERIEKHAVDAWIDNSWKELVAATNIGYKRILRFSETTSNKFRIRVLEFRFHPAISNVTAHYYKTRPPQLEITRTIDGQVNIQAKKHQFSWKPHGENSTENLSTSLEIRYTTDGSNPTMQSKIFSAPFLAISNEIKATAFSKDIEGSMVSKKLGIIKKDWKSISSNSSLPKYSENNAFDENPLTYWKSKASNKNHYLDIDLGENKTLKGFAYTPQKENANGMIEKGIIKTSTDGVVWKPFETFEFGNLINDPVTRTHQFQKEITTRYIRIEATLIAGDKKTATIAELDFLNN